jgi:hypothetical protein
MPSTTTLRCAQHPRYTFRVLGWASPHLLTLRVGVRRGEDPLHIIQLAVGEELLLSNGLLCQVLRVTFTYTGRRATIEATRITQIPDG